MRNRIRDYEDECDYDVAYDSPIDLDDDGGEWQPVTLSWREVLRIFAFVCVALICIAAVAWAARIGWGG